MLACVARESVCLVCQAPAGRLESLTLSPPREKWAWARNPHVIRASYPTAPRLPGMTRRCLSRPGLGVGGQGAERFFMFNVFGFPMKF